MFNMRKVEWLSGGAWLINLSIASVITYKQLIHTYIYLIFKRLVVIFYIVIHTVVTLFFF